MDANSSVDLRAIKALKARYCRFLDTTQWDSFRDLFTPDLQYFVDDPRIMATGAGEPTFVGPGPLVDYMVGADPLRISVHQCHTPEITFADAQTAHGSWAMFGWVDYPTRRLSQQVHGFYNETYRRCDDGLWRISVCRLSVLRHTELEPG